MSWKDLFEQNILKIGSEYCTDRAVMDLKVTKDKITAVVNDSELYNVVINLKNEEVVGMHCSCPYAQNSKNCKHMAAVLYKWERNKEYLVSNWGFYGQYYPDKLLAIKELRLNTGMSLKEAKDFIEELFEKIETANTNVNKNSTEPRKSYKSSSSGCCLVSLFLLVFYMPFRVIFGLTKRR